MAKKTDNMSSEMDDLQKKLLEQLVNSSKTSKRQSDLLSGLNKQVSMVSDIMDEVEEMEEIRKDMLARGNLKLATVASSQIDAYNEIIKENSRYADIVREQNSLQEQYLDEMKAKADEEAQYLQDAKDAYKEHIQGLKDSSDQLVVFGKEGTKINKATSLLNDKLVSFVPSIPLFGDVLDDITEKSGPKFSKGLLMLSAGLGMSTAVLYKYTDQMTRAASALPALVTSQDTMFEGMLEMGKMSFNTGLTLDELTNQMKENRVAWGQSSKQITSFIGENEALRLKMGLTREEFATQAAQATNFLRRQGVDQKNLSSETGKYLLNLNKVAIQTGRQATEIEEARRQSKMGAATFLATLQGDTRKAFMGAIDNLSDSGSELGKQMINMLSQGDVSERLKAAQDMSISLQQLGQAAGLSGDEITKYQSILQKAAMGDKDAAQQLATVNADVTKRLGDAIARGDVVLDSSFGGINEAANLIVQSLMEQRQIGIETGATFDEMAVSATQATNSMTKSAGVAEDMFVKWSKLSSMGPAVGDLLSSVIGVGSFVTGLIQSGPLLVAALGAVTAPMMLLAGGVAAAVAAFYYWDDIIEYLGKLVDKIKGWWDSFSFDGVADKVSDSVAGWFGFGDDKKKASDVISKQVKPEAGYVSRTPAVPQVVPAMKAPIATPAATKPAGVAPSMPATRATDTTQPGHVRAKMEGKMSSVPEGEFANLTMEMRKLGKTLEVISHNTLKSAQIQDSINTKQALLVKNTK